MQAVLRHGARSLLKSRAVPSVPTVTARGLATHVSESSLASAIPSTSSLSSITTAGRPSKKGLFVVKERVDQPKAPRYSPNSSRIRGRRESTRPRKSLAETGYDAEGNLEKHEVGELKIFLPSVFVRLVRNTGAHAEDPYTATFRTDLRLTKPDISNYLKNIYGLEITSIRTMNYLSKMKRNPIGGGYSRTGGTKNYKKVLVTLKEPFWYPDERSREWLNEHFQRDTMEEVRDRKMLKIGDGGKYGVSAQRYRGSHKSAEDLARREAMAASTLPTDGPSDGKASLRKPVGLRKQRNVIRSKAERVLEGKTKVEQEMERLRSEGW